MVGHGWAYTYHQRYSKHIPWIVDELYRNPQSRRAVISIRDNEADSISNDPACLQHIQFRIVDGKLDMQVLFRSNDLVKAFFFNAFALIRLQEIIAEQLNIPVGTYTHRSNSMHVYERDFELLYGMVNRINLSLIDLEDLTWNYEDYFKELMIDEVPEVEKLISGLKERYL
jgi:thymidylate synthase